MASYLVTVSLSPVGCKNEDNAVQVAHGQLVHGRVEGGGETRCPAHGPTLVVEEVTGKVTVQIAVPEDC